jgi:hypothetical protein
MTKDRYETETRDGKLQATTAELPRWQLVEIHLRSDPADTACCSATKAPPCLWAPTNLVDSQPLKLTLVAPSLRPAERLTMLSSRGLARNILMRRRYDCVRGISLKSDGYPVDFEFYPNFFSHTEQRVLLSAALHKLNMAESGRMRRLQRGFSTPFPLPSSVEDLFLPDDCYTFEEVWMFHAVSFRY